MATLSHFTGKKIAVLMGGLSSEREISLRSGENIAQALESAGLAVTRLDVGRDLSERLKDIQPDYAVIALHGTFGEDGCVQGLLELMGIPYTGSDVASSAIAMNKLITKKILKASGVPVPDFVEYTGQGLEVYADEITDKLGFPVVLKPNSEGSSVGVELIHDRRELDARLADYTKEFPFNFAEQYVSGKEITLGILGNRQEQKIFPILELRPKNEFYDFEAKYTKGLTDFVIPAELSPDASERAKDCARRSFHYLGLNGVARVDIMVDGNENLYVLEANTIPGFTETSDIPAMAAADGLSYEELVIRLLEYVVVP